MSAQYSEVVLKVHSVCCHLMAICLQMSLQKDMLTCWTHTHTHTQVVLQAKQASLISMDCSLTLLEVFLCSPLFSSLCFL